MSQFSKLASLLSGASGGDTALNEARFAALSRQVPVLYVILIINAFTLAISHNGLAPVWLTVYAPGVLCSACAVRLVVWWRTRHVAVPAAAIAKRLRATTILAAILGALFTSWSLSLFPYGGPYERGHVAIFMALTVLGCYLCLTHLPASLIALGFTGIDRKSTRLNSSHT